MNKKTLIRFIAIAGLSCLVSVLKPGSAAADNQTPTVSPVSTNTASLPYTVRLLKREMPKVLPTLQSFASGQSQGLWVLIGGRTNGLHNFTSNPLKNFPPRRQNARIWVIDPVSGRTWVRPLDDSSLTPDQVDGLSAFATESVQIGDTLYVAGGYGFSRSANNFMTFPTMTAFDLSDLIRWVRKEQLPAGKKDLASLIRQTQSSVLKVTGGQMMIVEGRAILAFGQLFDGGYGSTDSTQVYTGQVRSFDIRDNGKTLAIANIDRRPGTPNRNDYRRRDYNLVPILDTAGARPVAKAVGLAGVFTPTNGIFTVPVEIAKNGLPVMADPAAPSTFKQAMSGYNSASLPIYDSASGQSHAVLFGGISFVSYNKATGTFVQDSNFPFINDITSVVRRADGSYRQVLVGKFPIVQTVDDKRLRFGAEAALFLEQSVPVTTNGMIDLAKLKATHGTKPVHVGWIYGGIAAEKANFGATVASNIVFDIVLTPQ
jgi:hypothetical protein